MHVCNYSAHNTKDSSIFQHRLILSLIWKLLKLPPVPLTDFKLLKWNKTGT